MRLILAGLVTILALPAQAELSEQFASALTVFGPADPAAVTEGLDGTWIELLSYAFTLRTDPGSEAVRTYAEDFVERFCFSEPPGGGVRRLESEDPRRFTVRAATGEGGAIHYDWIVGTPIAIIGPSFMRTTHAPGDSDEAYRPEAWDGPVQVYRPSPDILVIAERNGETAIWGRCPQGA